MALSAFRNPDPAFWHGKRVLLTGHTGFKGAWLAIWLHQLGARVTGISLQPAAQPSLYSLANVASLCDSQMCDIRDAARLAKLVAGGAPEIVFHLAAQSLVRAGYHDPLATFSTNTLGTAHVLDALRPLEGVRALVAVTTDKVYRNLEQCYPYRESDELGGHDPYSASKAASEIIIASYRDAFLSAKGLAVASARAGNVIGGGDWSEDRLVPDAVRAWQTGRVLEVRRPNAIRPWQHVLEPLAAYLLLAETLWQQPSLAGPYNFGPDSNDAASVSAVLALARAAYGKGEIRHGTGDEGPHEAGWLALETAKSRSVLGIKPRWRLPEAVARTMAWYREQHQGADARALCTAEITAYGALA